MNTTITEDQYVMELTADYPGLGAYYEVGKRLWDDSLTKFDNLLSAICYAAHLDGCLECTASHVHEDWGCSEYLIQENNAGRNDRCIIFELYDSGRVRAEHNLIANWVVHYGDEGVEMVQ